MALRAALAGQAALLGAGFAGYTWYNRKPGRKAKTTTPLTAERVANAARDIVGSARGLGVVCISSGGAAAPNCRLMDTYLCDDGNLRVRLITKPHARKCGELRRGNEVTVTYHDPRDQGDNGYAALSGAVRELTELEEKERHWKSTWTFFHDRFSPMWELETRRVECISHRDAVAPSWRAAAVRRGEDGEWELVPRGT